VGRKTLPAFASMTLNRTVIGATPPSSVAPARSPLRAVAMPTEHGGWGLTSEPGLLGLLVAPSLAGGFIAMAAMVAFIARTPVRVVLVDGRRHRRLARTRLAARVAAVELIVLAGLIFGALLSTDHSFWVPGVVAVPLLAIELWYDMRSRSRRLIPELACAVAIASVAAMVALAGGASNTLAVGVWLILAARSVSSIPFVRARIQMARGNPAPNAVLVAADTVALAAAAVAVVLDRSLGGGMVAVVILVIAQRLFARGPVPAPKLIGMRQMALGFGLVALTALGSGLL
jgi:YwiC-like protein